MKIFKKIKCKLFGHDNNHSYLRYKQIDFDKIKKYFDNSLFEIDTDKLIKIIEDKFWIGKSGRDYCNNCNKLYKYEDFNKDFDNFMEKEGKNSIYSVKDIKKSLKNYTNSKKNSIYSAIPTPREGGFEKFMNK